MDFLKHLTSDQQFVLFSAIKVVGVFAVVMPVVAYAVYAERRIAAFIQDRLGPNRVGWFGLLQPVADGVKSFLKEDFTPAHVRKAYFWLAPMIVMIPSLLTMAVIPFGSKMGGQKMVIADLNVGILYTFGIVSLGIYGIVLAGYASNSKYPFLGGIRSSAQMISYEIAMGMSVVPVFLWVGNLNLSRVIDYQTTHGWLIWHAPVSFVIFLIASFAETNRLPFDLPESEQELVAGYNTEYSSMKFALFFMGEYANMIAVSAMMVTLFLGGWSLHIPGLPGLRLDQPGGPPIVLGVLHIAIFLAKMVALMGGFIWVRWMWPRFRYDQLMNLGWRVFIPLALANILATAVWLWIMQAMGWS
jgi:NADH-quinone oxidoreductase subunit H